MIDLDTFPRKIFVDKSSRVFPLTRKVLDRLKHVPFEVLEDPQSLWDDLNTAQDPVGEGKKYLYLTRQKGDFIKPCPCTPHYLGCRYYIINLDLNCPLDCSYCILQHYLSHPLVTIHVNTEELWTQLETFLRRSRGRRLRIGTGELGDSLVLDPLTGRAPEMISFFRRHPHALFELKTKTTRIKNILAADPAENIVIAWSLNSRAMAETQEAGAPPIEERIDAARTVQKRGFRTAFHFDPIIRYPGWQEGYAEVIEELLSRIPPERIAWISLGSLRFPPALKDIIRRRFPSSGILHEEFIPGLDGKYRYFKPLRLEMYRQLAGCFSRWTGSQPPLYFCMESREIWREVLKKEPGDEADVEACLTSPPGCCQ